MQFLSRQDAGKQLGKALKPFKSSDAVVLALPRGGAVVGAEIAKKLKLPLGILLVRKIGHPYQPEYAIGALAEDSDAIFDEHEVATLDLDWLKLAEADAREQIERRRKLYYANGFEAPEISGKVAILTDDGMATGLTMAAAVRAARSRHARMVVVAVPVASRESVELLEPLAGKILVLDDPDLFWGAIGAHYQDFEQVSDKEVRKLLLQFKDTKA